MSSLKTFIFCLILIFTTACSVLEPFVDRRRNAGARDKQHLYVGRSKPDAPAICYNSLWTNETELQNLADTECQKNNAGEYANKTGQSSFTCRLLLPSHAYYKCSTKN